LQTLLDLLNYAREVYREKTALAVRAGLREDAWSYARLWGTAHATAKLMRDEMGLRPGDRVIVWGPNCPKLVAAYFGAMAGRVIPVPVDPYSTGDFVSRVAEKTQASTLITGFAPPGIAALRTVNLYDLPQDGDGSVSPGELPGPYDTAEIVFTSGTTGDPKGVVLTHANIIANVESARTIIPETTRYRLLSLLPLSHMFEQTAGLYVPLLFGNTVYYPLSRQPPVVLKTLRRHRVVTMVVVPQILRMLLAGIEREVRLRGKERQWDRAHRIAARLPMVMRRQLFRSVHAQLGGSLEFFMCGGADLPPGLSDAWERMGIKVVEGYGTTECAPIIASNTLARRVSGSAGRTVTGVDMRLSGEGEILVRGPNVTTGYWMNETATRYAFEDGWYRTGDLGEVDRDGNLYLKGRLKDLIVLPSGMKVHPEDVEDVLRSEGAVADCVAVGLPDRTGAARVEAVVIPPLDGEGVETAHERVRQAVRNANARLAPHQRVADFTLWDRGDFPRTVLGKVKRHEVLAALTGRLPSPMVSRAAPGPVTDRVARLKAVLGEITGLNPAQISDESDLTLDLKLDSLARVDLAVRLEQDFGVAVAEEEMASAGTVADLMGLADRAAAAQPEAVTFPLWSLRNPARAARLLLEELLVFPAHRLLCHPFNVQGREHLHALSPPVLFVANHSSHADTPSILRALPARFRRRVAVGAAADYIYRIHLLGTAATLALNAFPFYREGPVRASLEYCGELMDRGWSVLLYPEGTRSPTGKLLPFKSGIGLLAAGLRVPVVPIAVTGTHAVLPKGAKYPRPGAVAVRFGAPVNLRPTDDYLAVAAMLEHTVERLVHYGVRANP
jgi:long-chain acyl-CoA synthetase